MNTVLMTRRTALLPAAGADLSILLTLWNDIGVRELLFEGQALSRPQAQQWLQAGVDAAAAGLGWWLVCPWNNGPALGCVGLLPNRVRDLPGDAVEVMVGFSAEAWAQGCAHEALTELVQHAVHSLCVPRLTLLCGLPSPLQAALVQTLGFKLLLEADTGQRRLRLHTLDAVAARRARAAERDPGARTRLLDRPSALVKLPAADPVAALQDRKAPQVAQWVR
jgi:RimJ/RimL family protein N-acetyltransferase